MNIAPFIAVMRRPEQGVPDAVMSFLTGLRNEARLELLLDHARSLILAASAAPHFLLPGSDGLVWGHLFDRVTSQRVAAAEALRGEAGEIEGFSKRFWGGYLRLRVEDNRVELARDPSGAVPCYHATIDGAEIFTSRPELLFDAGLMAPEIDWTIFTQALAYRDLRPARTAIRGMSELMPGTAATLSGQDLRIHCFWSPWKFAVPQEEFSLASAAQQVKRVADNCIGAWGRCFDRPLVEVSGGLDSSIVAAAIAARHPHASCVTFASAHGDPDETPYAQAMAVHLGVPLHVLRAHIGDIDLVQSQARNLPRPCARGFAQALDARLTDTAARLKTDAFFSGGGGDNVFCYLQSVLPVIDRFRSEGVGTGLIETMSDLATLAGVSLWEVGRRALGRALRQGGPRAWTFDDKWLSREAVAHLPLPTGHPWLEAPEAILPGKRVHGQALIVIQNHLEGFDRLHSAPVISPLLSQPLVETCMAIPTWLWCAGGENRAVARRAFTGRLPAPVLARQTKGAFDSYCAQIFEANRRMITLMLLDGELAGHGIIDAAAVRAALSAPQISRTDIMSLLGLVDAEAWAMAWTARA